LKNNATKHDKMADIPGLVAGLVICPADVSPAADTQMLNRMIAQLIGIPSAARRAGNDPLWRALHGMGITRFFGDLLTLTEDDIMALEAPPTRAGPHPGPVPLMVKGKPVMAIAAYQYYSRVRGASIDMQIFPLQLYDHFRVSIYRHDEKIIPWQAELPSQLNAKATFLESIKPNSKEYKVFCEDKNWLTFKESTETTIMSHNLVQMIAPPFLTDPVTGEVVLDPHGDKIQYEPEDLGLDEMQRTSFFKVLVDVCQTPVAKKIVNSYRNSVDTRMVWHDMCAHYQNSFIVGPFLSSYC